MTARTCIALGAAALAIVAGATTADLSHGHALDDRAVAAEVTPGPDAAHVSNAKLRRVDGLELDAESMTLRRGDRTVAVASMRNADETVALLDRLFGTPSRTQTAEGDGGRCFPAGVTYTWGGGFRVAALTSPSDLGNALEVRILRSEVRARTGGLVELSGPDDVQVGDDVHDLIDDARQRDRESLGSGDATAWQVLLAEGWPSDRAGAGTNGVSALTDDTTVTVIGSPLPVNADHGC
ncbi:hypothetical protein [Curtobacterium sp. VKM Ac-2922]|uniref:hypothetical protein n=1 Tax=Curtobacterium sp. VKM Ac-2922 TaxID=2929475 RepID=UPI001FB48E22|nr:hypothetical protein [Curtobacterium sp. VKM Ac-2922]MCJ1715896.1 hypothetical protein [Curtobacterium sp. VKM Ac-2922]